MTDEEYKRLRAQRAADDLAEKQSKALGVPPPPSSGAMDPATAAAQARAQVAQQRAAAEAPSVGANPTQGDPGAIDRMLYGTGQYDPSIPNTPPNILSRGDMSPAQIASVGGSMLTTSDPDALANIWEKNVPGAQRGRDPKGATIVSVPFPGAPPGTPPYKFHPNPPGALDLPSILSFGGQAATDAAAAMATGGVAPATVMAGTQLARGELGAAAGTQENQWDIGKTAAGAGLFAKLGQAIPSIGGAGYRGAKTALSQTFGRSVNEDLAANAFKKFGFDWDNLPAEGRKRILDSMQGWSPSEALAALQNGKNVEALWHQQSAKEFGGETAAISKGRATGDTAELNKESLLAAKAPESRLAQQDRIDPRTGQPVPKLPEKLPGLLDDMMRRGDVEGGMKEVQTALKELPPQHAAELTESQAWNTVSDKLGGLKLTNSKDGGPQKFVKDSLGYQFDVDRSPSTQQALADIAGLRAKRGPIRADDAIKIRNQIDGYINAARANGNRIDVENLTKLRAGYDKWLDSNAGLAGSAEFQAARSAQAEAFKYGPDGPFSSQAEKVVRELRNDVAGDIPVDSAWKLASQGPHSPEVMKQIVEQLGGHTNPGVVKLQGGYLREKLLDDGSQNVADMSASALSKKLGTIVDDDVAKNLFPPGELAQMRRARDLLDAMGRRGATPEATWKATRDLMVNLPALAVAMGSGALVGPGTMAMAVLGRRAIGAVTRPVIGAIGDINAGKAAARQMDFPGIAFRPPAAGPGAMGAGAVGGAAVAPQVYAPGETGPYPARAKRNQGLMDQPQPLAIEGLGMGGLLGS